MNYTIFDTSNSVAKMLLDVNAVVYRPEIPFTFASGRTSPIYIDVRLLLNYPSFRNKIVVMAMSMMMKDIGLQNIDVIVGGATAGIAWAALIANRLDKRMAYVRTSSKQHGTYSQVEGVVEPGDRALLIDDLMSEGATKQDFIAGLSEAGCVIEDILVIFNYGCFGEPDHLYGVRSHWLTDLWSVLEVADDQPCYLSPHTADIRRFITSIT